MQVVILEDAERNTIVFLKILIYKIVYDRKQ